MSVAPVATSIPSSESGDGVSVTVESASQFSVIMPMPQGIHLRAGFDRHHRG